MSFKRLAKAVVKFAGMCWTMTIPGILGGIWVRTSLIASVPPVEAPMAITLFVVSARAKDGRGFAEVTWQLSLVEAVRGFTLMWAAALILSRSWTVISATL